MAQTRRSRGRAFPFGCCAAPGYRTAGVQNAAARFFTRGRRSAAFFGEAPKEPAAKLPNLTLVGIFLSVDRRQALVERGQPPRVEWISERQKLDGWTVEEIR